MGYLCDEHQLLSFFYWHHYLFAYLKTKYAFSFMQIIIFILQLLIIMFVCFIVQVTMSKFIVYPKQFSAAHEISLSQRQTRLKKSATSLFDNLRKRCFETQFCIKSEKDFFYFYRILYVLAVNEIMLSPLSTGPVIQ